MRPLAYEACFLGFSWVSWKIHWSPVRNGIVVNAEQAGAACGRGGITLGRVYDWTGTASR